MSCLTVGNLKGDETDEEEGRNVGEVVALKTKVLGQAHHGGIVEDDLVEELHGVGLSCLLSVSSRAHSM